MEIKEEPALCAVIKLTKNYLIFKLAKLLMVQISFVTTLDMQWTHNNFLIIHIQEPFAQIRTAILTVQNYLKFQKKQLQVINACLVMIAFLILDQWELAAILTNVRLKLELLILDAMFMDIITLKWINFATVVYIVVKMQLFKREIQYHKVIIANLSKH